MNKLPDLPKQNKHKEADAGILFRKWWNTKGMNAPYEMKDSRGKDSIAFSEVSDDQLTMALAANSETGVLIRISSGTIGAPDYIGLRNSPYWIVIRYPKSFEIIGIQSFVFEKSRNKKKSLTYERAQAISSISIKL